MTPQYSKQAAKYLNSQDRQTQQRIREGIEKIPEGDIKPLKGATGTYRLRVGDWRILFSHMSDSVYIRNIGARGGIYKGG